MGLAWECVQVFCCSPIISDRNILNNIWVRVERSLLQQPKLQKINCNSSSLHSAGRMWMKLLERVGHWSQNSSIKYSTQWKIYSKIFVYFKFNFHNYPVKKVILRFFSRHEVICQRCHLFGKYVTAIFLLQYLNSCSPVRTGIIRFGSKYSKNQVFSFKNF